MPSAAPVTPDEAYKKLEQENAELKEDIESLTMMVERLRSEVERVRIRQANANANAGGVSDGEGPRRKRSSAAFMQGSRTAGYGSKSTPSPATVSALDLSTPVSPSGRLGD